MNAELAERERFSHMATIRVLPTSLSTRIKTACSIHADASANMIAYTQSAAWPTNRRPLVEPLER